MQRGIINVESRRVLIADPHPLFRLGLLTLLSSAYPDWGILEANSLREHRKGLETGEIDLLIISSQLLGLELANGTQITDALNLWLDIVAITEPNEPMSGLGCIAAGAHATFSRSDPSSHVLQMIEKFTLRRRKGMAAPANPPLQVTKPETPPNLSDRQRDILDLLAKGQSNKAIARVLNLSVSTVKTHLNTVFKALGAQNRVEAVVLARQAGLASGRD